MANGAANTYTTYLRTELDPATRQSYSQLRTLAEATYRDIGRLATEASNTAAAGFGDRRSTSGFRNLELAAASSFGNIRREAASTSAAVSSMQARLSNIRTSALANVIPQPVSPSRAAATGGAAAVNDNLAAANRRVAASAAGVVSAQTRQFASTAALGGEATKLSRGLTVLGTTLSVVQGPLGPIAGRINAITAAVSTLGTGTLVLAGAATALFAFAGVANVYAEVESRLKPLYSTQEQVNGALRETGRIALATRSALGPTADLYAKLTSAGREFGISQRQISRVTETAAKAATLSGGSAASREAGLYQFSQGLSSNKLGGDELKSILENIPELARAIASGFKNVDGTIGVSTGELRKMGAEGKLTAQVIADALSRASDTVDAKFSKLPKTIGSAKTEFITAFTLLTGSVDHTVGVTQKLANAISVAANNLQLLLALGGAFAARFILPKLGAFLAEQRTAIAQQAALRSATAQAQGRLGGTLVTQLTPTGIEQAKASTAAVGAAQASNDARARVAAEGEVVAAIERERLALLATAEADREKTRSNQANARFDVIATEQRVAALQAELAVRNEAKAVAATNVATFASAAPLVNRPLAAGEQDAARSERIAGFTKQQTAAKLELGQADLRAAATARQLAAAQAELAAATETATGATLTQTQAANQNAARGFAAIGLAQQQALAEVAKTEAIAAATLAEEAEAAALARLTAAQTAYNAASSRAVGAFNAIRGGASALSAALGGPLMIALTAVTGALIYMAGQSNAALDALHSFAGGQDELRKRLGLTTDSLREQTEEARKLTLALAQANVVKARTARQDANADLAASVGTFASQIAPGVGGRLGNAVAGALPGLATAQQRQAREDSEKLFRLQGQLATGVISKDGRKVLTDLLVKYPGAAKDSGLDGALNRFAGRAAGDTADKLLGTEATRLNQIDADRTLADVVAAQKLPPAPPRKPVQPLTNEQILAQGAQQAGSLDTKRKLLADRFEEQKQSILGNTQYDEQRKIREIAQATAAYKEQLAALDKRDAAAAKAISAKADREAAKAAREAAAATRDAAAATEKLTDLRAKYNDDPKLVDNVRNDQRAFASLVGKQINVVGPDGQVEKDAKGRDKRRTYTTTDARLDSSRAEEALNKPFNDVTREMERQLQIQTLQLQGRDAEADALQRSFQLVDRTGILQTGQYQQLVDLADAQNTINAALEERGRIVSTLRGTVDSLRDSVTSFLNDIPNAAAKVGSTITGKDGEQRRYGTTDFLKETVGGLGGNVFAGFQSAKNKLGVDGLFGGIQKKIDDMISGRTGLVSATDFAATQTKKTGTAVQKFGDVITEVTGKVSEAIQTMQAGVGAGPVGGPGIESPFSADGTIASLGGGSAVLTATTLAKEVDGLGAKLRGESEDTGEDIVVTGKRPKTRDTAAAQRQEDPGQRAPSLRQIYNEQGKAIGDKLDKALGTKFLGGLGNKLGDALNGASRGQFASNIASAIGIKQSATGAKIGGAIGSFVPIPFGAEIGGLIGGTIGGLFKKAKVGSAGISTDQFGQLGAAAPKGTNGKAITAATGLAGSVADGLQQIADQLGAKITGTSNVQIGTYKDQLRVSTNGTPIGGKGSSGAITFKDEQEAVQYAIRDAISDGVLSGISEASQRILKSGQDLNKAIQKALLIESIPKRLLAATDPVRAAVNDLNEQYTQLIAALNEGQASAQQYADAQKLYDIDRAKTIADAAKSATSAIDDYLKGMLSGSSSPLNKFTVYQNATKDLSTAQSDFAAGKIDDQGLVAAAQKFQDASAAFNGRNSSFFSDFDMLTKLLTDAKASKAVLPGASNTDLPGSPFANDSGVQAALSASTTATVKATQDQTAVLGSKLDAVVKALADLPALGVSNDKGFSSLDNLAAFR
jgi:tape measure domain-containing protein